MILFLSNLTVRASGFLKGSLSRFFKRFSPQNFKLGFSLTELSIAMTIVAMLAAAAISTATTSDYYSKLSQTNAKLDKIEAALASFLNVNKRLPCPADGTLASTNASFGLEGTPSSSSCSGSNYSSGNIYVGTVPITTLQLPDDFAFDGWGNRFMYAVDYRFANNTTTNGSCTASGAICFIDTELGGITVNSATGARTTSAVLALISYGENGHGAFSKNGSATRINYYTASTAFTNVTDELENAHFSIAGADTAFNATFVMKEAIRKESGEYFDDIVRFKEKTQITQEAGAVFYESICRSAQNIVNNSSSNSCSGAADSATCASFAVEISNRCL